jgi:SAM-dependent methyltransferase
VNRLGRFLPRRAQDAIHVWRVRTRDRLLFGAGGDIRDALPERFVRTAFQIMLRRDAEPAGLENYLTVLESGALDPDGVLDEMLTSMELRIDVPFRNILRSLHQSRCDFVRMLPRARRILDLGGADQERDAGALVTMGYPYPFELLTVVDLPGGDRHALYGHMASSDTVESRLGPVEYRYHSMVDLSDHANGSFDLVFSGQTIEHISEEDARKMLVEVRRVLAPGGWFCLDTPNRRVTALQLGADVLSNPDHKLEYTDEHLSALLRGAGFEISAAFGLSLADESLRNGRFDEAEVAAKHGVYAEIADCYFLAYMCRIARPPIRFSSA